MFDRPQRALAMMFPNTRDIDSSWRVMVSAGEASTDKSMPSITIKISTYLADLPTNTPACSHKRDWSRNGRHGCSDIPHEIIVQMIYLVDQSMNITWCQKWEVVNFFQLGWAAWWVWFASRLKIAPFCLKQRWSEKCSLFHRHANCTYL